MLVTPARSAASTSSPSASAASGSALATSRKNEPYSEPLAPPTFEMNVMPTDFSSARSVSASSSFGSTAAIPRFRFVP